MHSRYYVYIITVGLFMHYEGKIRCRKKSLRNTQLYKTETERENKNF